MGRLLTIGSSWMNLESLHLSRCNLESSVLQSLVTAQLPQLIDLNLDHELLNYNVIEQLVKGQCAPSLDKLLHSIVS